MTETEQAQKNLVDNSRVIVRLIVFGVIAFVLAVSLSTCFLVIAYSHTDDATCRVRNGFVSFVDSSLQRSQRSAEATVLSDSASPEQKTAARVNLQELRSIIANEHEHTRVPHCPFPPTKNVPQLPATKGSKP